MNVNFIDRHVKIISLSSINVCYFSLAVLFLILTTKLHSQSPEIPTPQFRGSFSNTSDAGHIKLVWQYPNGLGPGAQFELQQANDAAFRTNRTIYLGPDLASFVSGLPNGEYYFRIRTRMNDGRTSFWSRALSVKVEHQSLQLAFSLFGIGALVFVATLAVVFFGSRKAAKEKEA